MRSGRDNSESGSSRGIGAKSDRGSPGEPNAGEIRAALPADELVAAGVSRTTRAVTIGTPIDVVWKWLVPKLGIIVGFL